MAAPDADPRFVVAVRCRPLSDKERAKRDESCLHVLESKLVVAVDPGHFATNVMRQQRLQKERRYAFDYAFGESRTTADVHAAVTSRLVNGVVEGFNSSCFAYGPTGTGKTYSMLGSPETPGLMVLVLRDLYRALRARGGPHSCRLSYIEIYNEAIRDLLCEGDDDAPASLELREDPIRGMVVAAVSEHAVADADAAMALLLAGNRRRTQEPTAANRESSRSHAVLQITVTTGDAHGAGDMRIGKLSMCDLAGSERAANTENRGLRLLEGASINRSLLALGNCITALVQGKGSFVPYRDSKLTRLLKDSLGGASTRTVMLCCVSPASAAFEESVNTLKYANRAKAIRVEPGGPPLPNVVSATHAVSEYESLIAGLRGEVAELRARLVGAAKASPLPPPRAAATRLPPAGGRAGGSGAGAAGGGGGAGGGGDGERARPATADGGAAPRGPSAALRADAARLRDELVAVYEERMQLRRSLAELAAQNEDNEAAVARRRARVARWEAAARRAGGAPPDAAAVAAELREVARLQGAGASNAKTKASLAARLAENERAGTGVRTRLEALIAAGGSGGSGSGGGGADAASGGREVLALELRVHVLELDKVELESGRLLFQRMLKQRQTETRKLRLQVQARDAALAQAAALLEAHGLGSALLADLGRVSALDEELAAAGGDDEGVDEVVAGFEHAMRQTGGSGRGVSLGGGGGGGSATPSGKAADASVAAMPTLPPSPGLRPTTGAAPLQAAPTTPRRLDVAAAAAGAVAPAAGGGFGHTSAIPSVDEITALMGGGGGGGGAAQRAVASEPPGPPVPPAPDNWQTVAHRHRRHGSSVGVGSPTGAGDGGAQALSPPAAARPPADARLSGVTASTTSPEWSSPSQFRRISNLFPPRDAGVPGRSPPPVATPAAAGGQGRGGGVQVPAHSSNGGGRPHGAPSGAGAASSALHGRAAPAVVAPASRAGGGGVRGLAAAAALQAKRSAVASPYAAPVGGGGALRRGQVAAVGRR